MAIGDEVYKVHFGSAGGKLTASQAATGSVSDALTTDGHTLTVRLGTQFSNVTPAWGKVAGLLKDLPNVRHRLAITLPVTLVGTDPTDTVVVFKLATNSNLLAALQPGKDAATLVVTLDKGDAATAMAWKDVAAVLEKFDVTFEADMTCVGDGG